MMLISLRILTHSLACTLRLSLARAHRGVQILFAAGTEILDGLLEEDIAWCMPITLYVKIMLKLRWRSR